MKKKLAVPVAVLEKIRQDGMLKPESGHIFCRRQSHGMQSVAEPGRGIGVFS